MGSGSPVILLIEDEALVRFAVAELLEELGFVVEMAASAKEATAHLRAPDHHHHHYRVVIVDLGLPDSSGEDLVRNILAELIDVPVIIASGDDPSSIDLTLTGDARVAFLSKPYGARGMIQVLDGLGIVVERPLDG
jgi:DNA-binding response OmpR family regulator